jgi:integrase/recombinase XerD
VSVIVDRAFARAQVSRPSRGAAQLLRHSVATSMLRHGASLQDVASLLRHRSVTTTEIYAKVDVTALQMIAQPWPEVPSC